MKLNKEFEFLFCIKLSIIQHFIAGKGKSVRYIGLVQIVLEIFLLILSDPFQTVAIKKAAL